MKNVVYSRNDITMFPSCIKPSNLPHFEKLGTPILYCANFISSKHQQAARLLSRLEGVARIDPQVALLLLRICAGFCKLVHLARTTPPRLASESLLLFDDDVRHCFSSCAVIDIPDEAWKQAQLCLSFGGLGIRPTSLHSSAAYIASLSISGFGYSADQNLMQAVDHFNSLVLPSDVISVESVLNAPVLQRDLSKKIDRNLFKSLLISSSLANRARLL